MSDQRDRAVALFVNYFRAVALKAGMNWDPDYSAEIGEAVDCIIEATIEDLKLDDYDTLAARVDESVRRLDKHEREIWGVVLPGKSASRRDGD